MCHEMEKVKTMGPCQTIVVSLRTRRYPFIPLGSQNLMLTFNVHWNHLESYLKQFSGPAQCGSVGWCIVP